MCCNPNRAFRGLVSLPEIDHQAAHCIPQPGLGVFSSNVFSAVQLSKLTEQKMCPQVQKQMNSILCFHIDVPVWIIFKILGIHLAYPCGKEPIENGDNWGTGLTATHCVGYGSQNREEGLHSLLCWSCPWAETKGDRWPLHSSTLLGIGSSEYPPFRESL